MIDQLTPISCSSIKDSGTQVSMDLTSRVGCTAAVVVVVVVVVVVAVIAVIAVAAVAAVVVALIAVVGLVVQPSAFLRFSTINRLL